MKIRIAPVRIGIRSQCWPGCRPPRRTAARSTRRSAPCATAIRDRENRAWLPSWRDSKEVADVLTKGGEAKAPHIKPMSTLTPAQAAAIAAFVKTLK